MAAALISEARSIVTILPKDEGFSPSHFGAIALCVRDFTLQSMYGSATTVISGVQEQGFEGIYFRPAPEARWYENRTKAYARFCAGVINKQRTSLAEVHNRPNLLRLIARRVSCKLALHLHNDPQEMRDAKTPAERGSLLELCSGIYCVSAFIRDRFIEGVTGDISKVHVVHNGIAIPESLPPKEKLIVFAGRMTEGKGALLLAEALALALPQMPDWRAVLIGSDRHSVAEDLSPREMQLLEALAPVAAQAQMRGFLLHGEVLSYFARSAIAVVPSIWQEPFGRTAIEAMAYGCATVSSGRGALLEVTGDAAHTLFDLTAPALAEALVALGSDENHLAAMQHKARNRSYDFTIAKSTRLLDNARNAIFSESSSDAA